MTVEHRSTGDTGRPSHEEARNRATKVCEETTGVHDLLEQFGSVVITYLADSCATDLVEDDGSIRRYLTLHADSDKQQKLSELRTQFPLGKTAAYGYPRVIKTGKSQFIPGVTRHLAYRLLPGPDLQEAADGIPVRSFICVPIMSRGRILGALTVANTDRPSVLSAADLVLVEELAELLGECLDARLYGN